MLTEVPLPRGPLLPEVVRVRDFRQETHDVYTLTLEPAAPYSFRPGQFNMLYAFGVGEVPISVSSDPAEAGQSLLHTIRAVGSVTNALGKLRAGDAVGMRGPFGSCWPVEAARGHDVVFVTGGIGLAPLRPAIYHVLRHREDYGRLVLLHGSRSPADLLFADELHAWRRRPDFQVLLTVDRADASWHGAIGPVTTLFGQANFEASRAVGLMCGPEVMMRFTIYEFEKCGVPHGRLYVSLERNMQCAVGFCGHCQFGPHFICMDGPVFRYDRVEPFFVIREA
jgi:NAD(P)H-flavin reductase